MASPDLVNLNMYIQKGKPFPKKLDKKGKKGLVSTESLAGYSKYTARSDASVTNEENMKLSPGGYFKYSSERQGSTRTYTNEGWKDSPEEMKEFRNFVAKHFMEDGNIAWLPVQSFKDYATASQYGLFKDEDYAQVIERSLESFFDKAGFDKSNMIWWMNYHTNKDHPHVHLVFLEKEKTRTKGTFTQEELKFFKREILTNMMDRERLLSKTQNTIKQNFKDIDGMKKNLVLLGEQAFHELKSVELDYQIKRLYKELPTSGRLQYGSSQMIPFREKIDRIVDVVLEHKSVKPELDKCIEEWNKLDKVYEDKLNENTSNIKDSELNKIRKQIANEILSGAKNYHRDNYSSLKEETSSKYKFRENKVVSQGIEDDLYSSHQVNELKRTDKQENTFSKNTNHLGKALNSIKKSTQKAKHKMKQAQEEYLKDGESNKEIAGLDI